MFKLGRGGGGGGGGRGGGKRPLPPPHVNRPAAGGGARVPIGGPQSAASRGRGSVAAPGRDESFRLESGGSLDFAAIIRLAPDLVEEIRRAEAQGSVARIKFDSNLNNSSGNVIDVDGKEFQFTWSRELGDLCDIYEEHRNGEDGNGLLVECGSAWRKLNVQRILDESTKNHVKMRSEEAERLSKSRKAIVLDPANPSVKNQAKSMAAAAVEGNMRRMSWKHKKELYFKKRKVEPSQAPIIASSKSVSKKGALSNNVAKGFTSVSPIPSPLEQSGPGTSASPIATGTAFRGSNNDDIISLNINRDEASNFEKEAPSVTAHGVKHRISGHSTYIGDKPKDLRSILINLLAENPKGMSLKDLEKAVGERISNPGKKIESILKTIATLHVSGSYYLKPGAEVESSKRDPSDCRSSPDNATYNTSVAESNKQQAASERIEEKAQLSSNVEEELDLFEQIDGEQSLDPVGGKTVDNDSDGRACSSSESGSESESESDSSDSGSDSESQSRSKSRSPVGSGSASSSDSESDGSSSSKEGSDVLVDITTSDDDKDVTERKTVASDLNLSPSPRVCRISEGGNDYNDLRNTRERKIASPHLDPNDYERGDEMVHASEDTENRYRDNNDKAVEISETGSDMNTQLDFRGLNSRFPEGVMSFSHDQLELPADCKLLSGRSLGNNEKDHVPKHSINEKPITQKDGSIHELSNLTEINSKSKLKRTSVSENFPEKPERGKRPKAANSAEFMSFSKNKDASVSENSHFLSPDRPKGDWYKETNNSDRDGHIDVDLQGCSPADHGRLVASGNLHRLQQSPDSRAALNLDAEQSRQKIEKLNGRKKGSMQKPNSYVNYGGGSTYADGFPVYRGDSDASAVRNTKTHDKLSVSNDKGQKSVRDAKSDDINGKFLIKNGRESDWGNKFSSIPDPYEGKSGGYIGIAKGNGQPSVKQIYDVKKSPINGKPMLQRELSDLELGEFREPLVGDMSDGTKRQIERKGSFKSLDNKVTATDNSYSDISVGRTAAKTVQQKKLTPPTSGTGIQENLDGFQRRVAADDFVDTSRPPQRVLSQNQHFSRVDHPDSEAMSNLDRSAEILSKNETRTSQGMNQDQLGSNKKNPAGRLSQHDNKHGGKGRKNSIESKPQKSNALGESVERSKNGFFMENDVNIKQRKYCSSDEDNSFYSKYDKHEPELKGPIKDFLQYKEYVQEYQEKYGAYYSLNEQLEKTMNDFRKVGYDLDLAKRRDMKEYYSIVEKLRDMYHKSGARHKHMKKVFVLLHEELKSIKQRIKDFVEAYTKE
ncbi:uncharacterized protein [Typha angustifolia]|uniref:uncharacterized protein n=1 Tax=Typha angustifolia TaxID=59011 RepID=UPI003C2DC7C4